MIAMIKRWFGCSEQKWQDLYEEKRLESQKWEFKFNKLQRQLAAILKEAGQ